MMTAKAPVETALREGVSVELKLESIREAPCPLPQPRPMLLCVARAGPRAPSRVPVQMDEARGCKLAS